MYTFKELKKGARRKTDGKEYRLAVLGNCATQFLAAAVMGCAKLSGINLNVFDADYNQIDAQLLDSSSQTYEFLPDYILLYLSAEKLYEEFLDLDSARRSEFAQAVSDRMQRYWNLIAGHCGAKILQMNFTEINDKAFGNYGVKTESSFTYQIRKLNALTGEMTAQRRDVWPVDLLSVQIMLGTKRFYDPVLYYNAKMTIALDALPYAAWAVTSVVRAMQGKIKKCIILDLDNTLWGGVIGDDGLGGIEIGELGRGHAFTDFQRWLRQMKDRGVLLAVCSKNNEETAKEPFEKHEEMILKLSDISIFTANWDDKASNIRKIQQSLNIGMDSIVFIDDNPFERHLVKSMLPEVEVPDMPEDPAEYLSFLQNSNLFETASFSSEDKDRTGQYQAEFQRRELEQSFASIDDYLKSLQMTGEARPFAPVRYARIAQLTQRSNQFNVRTVRYTEDEIQKIAEDDSFITLYYTLKDQFGDHGLVSVVIMKKVSDQTLFMDTWLMSCRVLKRGMEEFIVNGFVAEAAKQGFSNILAQYIPTPKNGMVKDIYQTMGFTEITADEFWKAYGAAEWGSKISDKNLKNSSGSYYELKTADYTQKQTFIKQEDEHEPQ